MTAAAVEVRGFGYRAAGRDRWVPRHLSFDIARGERILLLGSSGSGKSTILRALAHLLDASGAREGEVVIDDQPVSQARQRIGLMMQDPTAFLVLDKIGDDVAFGPQNQGLPPDVVADRVHDALKVVGLDIPLSHPVDQLSGGERQRVALAGVLAMQPDLLLLDEPTSQLDPAGSRLIVEAVGRAVAHRETTLVIVEHRVDEWLELIDRVFILDGDGNLVTGSVSEVIDSEAARDTWLHPPRQPVGAPAPRARTGQAAPTTVLQASDVTHRFHVPGPTALSDVSCAIGAGRVTAISGANGSGKSTLARALGGLLVPSAGSIRATARLLPANKQHLLATDVGRWSSPDLAGRIGSVFQNPESSFVAQTVQEEVEFGPHAIGKQVRTEYLLERLGLTHLAQFNPFTLSGGEQRRLSVAAALASSPDILILDEPTFGQDPRTWSEMVQLVLAQRDEGRAVVVVSHDQRFVASVADHCLHLEAGRLTSDDCREVE